MSEGDIQVILHRLDQLESTLRDIYSEVRRTNGRVTDLEMTEAKWEGREESRRMYGIVGTSVLSGGILAAIIWFVTNAI